MKGESGRREGGAHQTSGDTAALRVQIFRRSPDAGLGHTAPACEVTRAHTCERVASCRHTAALHTPQWAALLRALVQRETAFSADGVSDCTGGFSGHTQVGGNKQPRALEIGGPPCTPTDEQQDLEQGPAASAPRPLLIPQVPLSGLQAPSSLNIKTKREKKKETKLFPVYYPQVRQSGDEFPPEAILPLWLANQTAFPFQFNLT